MKVLRMILCGIALLLILSIGSLLYLRHCDWNPKEAAEYATQNAEKKSVGLCALYVRKAIIAGGIPLYRGGDAWSYKYLLPIIGFEEVKDKADKKMGDIVVFQPIGGRKFGHIAMWNGQQWVSDFKQRSLFVHSDYRREGCEYTIFRRE